MSIGFVKYNREKNHFEHRTNRHNETLRYSIYALLYVAFTNFPPQVCCVQIQLLYWIKFSYNANEYNTFTFYLRYATIIWGQTDTTFNLINQLLLVKFKHIPNLIYGRNDDSKHSKTLQSRSLIQKHLVYHSVKRYTQFNWKRHRKGYGQFSRRKSLRSPSSNVSND